MKFTQFSTLRAVALAALLSSCSESAKQADYNIVPLPLSIEQGEGQADFRLKNGVVISYPSAQPELQKEAQFLADYVKKSTSRSKPTPRAKGASRSAPVSTTTIPKPMSSK
jgi:hexosaminidase